MKKAAIYARTATQGQTAAWRIQYQISCLKEKIESDGNVIGSNCIYSDAGFSGNDCERPGLIRLLQDANDKKFDILYIENVDRLTRNYLQYELITSALANFEIEVMTLGGQLDFNSFLLCGFFPTKKSKMEIDE